jgi:nucleoside-diphosphate-sugar epimerase
MDMETNHIQGFLGMHILEELLATNHSVRVLTRSQEKGEHIESQFPTSALPLDVIVVEDQLAEGAYDKAAQGVEAVIHTALPFFFTAKDNEEEMIKPARAITFKMLSAAAKSASVRRVMLTSSLAAMVNPFNGLAFKDTTYTAKTWNSVKRDQVEGPVLEYLALKMFAERDAWDFVEREKPLFDLVTMCPTLVVGVPLQEVKSMDQLNTSFAVLYSLFDAKQIPDNGFPCVVSVTDVAKAHVRSLDVKEARGHRFICHG